MIYVAREEKKNREPRTNLNKGCAISTFLPPVAQLVKTSSSRSVSTVDKQEVRGRLIAGKGGGGNRRSETPGSVILRSAGKANKQGQSACSLLLLRFIPPGLALPARLCMCICQPREGQEMCFCLYILRRW